MSPKNKLDEVQIPSPCTADWETMVGNNQVRFCEHCNLSVNNLSAMTRQRALRLVANSRGRLCVRFVQGVDGAPLTNLPAKLHRLGRRVSRLTAGAFSAALSLSTAAAQSPTPNQTVATAPAQAKSDAVSNASIAGTIDAARDKPIAGAIVTLQNKETGVELIAATSNDGAYNFQFLMPGTYSMTIRADGYDDSEFNGLTMAASAARKMNVTLDPTETLQSPVEGPRTPLRVTFTGGAIAVAYPVHPLVAAAFKDDLAAVKEQLFAGADANTLDQRTNVTALEYAVEHNNREMVETLLVFNANANGGKAQRSALMSLRDNATPELVLDLISAGASVNQPDENGETPLMHAASTSNLAAVQTLIKMGAKPHVSDNSGETPLMKAAANDDPNVTKLLLELGADVNAHDVDGKTALLLAASSKQPAMIKLLLDAGARTDASDKEGKTPLLIAAAEDNADVVALLIDAGADINAHDSDGQTPLMAAASEGLPEVVKLLIDAGADVDARDKEGQTALMQAAVAGDADSIRLLLNAGADFKLHDKDGKTALALAVGDQREEALTLLRSRGAPE